MEQDSVFARYKPTDNVRLQDDGGPNQSDAVRPVLIPFDRVVRGNIQENTSKYTINEEIKNSGVDLRFDIKIQHRFDAVDTQGIGVSYFANYRTLCLRFHPVQSPGFPPTHTGRHVR